RKVDLAAFANALAGREGDPQGVAFGVRAQQFRVCLSVHGPDKVAALLRVRIVPANGNALESTFRVADRPRLGDRPSPELGHMVEDACVALNSEGGRERKARRHHRRSLDVGTPVPIFYRDHRMLRDPARPPRAASIIASASRRVSATGVSQKTCFPSAKAETTSGRWRPLGVVTSMASIDSSLRIFCGSVNQGALTRFASARAFGAERLTIPA